MVSANLYLVDVLRTIATTLKEKGEDALLGGKLKAAAMGRVFGFELLPAPFVVAHLQLGLFLQGEGVPLEQRNKERAGVYFTNALKRVFKKRSSRYARMPFAEVVPSQRGAGRMRELLEKEKGSTKLSSFSNSRDTITALAQVSRLISGELPMPYDDHTLLKKPGDDQIIWRYMDFPKFVSMITSKTLHFTRADQLGDPFEGSFPIPLIDVRTSLGIPADAGGISESLLPGFDRAMRDLAEPVRQAFFANCWNIGETESLGMWNSYVKSLPGMAIKSTFGRLKQCFAPAPQLIHAGQVRYLDYEKDRLPFNWSFDACMTKRLHYSYEQELRAIFLDERQFPIAVSIQGATNPVVSSNVAVDLKILVTEVVLFPGSQPWFGRLAGQLLNDYGLEAPVKHSLLDSKPVWRVASS